MKSKQKKRFLIVCTGNTCRSPMAAVVLNQLLEKEGLSEKYEATSAGVAAFDGLRCCLTLRFLRYFDAV